MLNTPPDFKVAEVRNDCELESCSSCGYCEQYKQPELCDEKVDGQQAIVEVAKLAVEVKKLEATATVEVERLRQHGVTARVRISEENKTQRSACVAALVKRVVEEHHQTEREKIAATAETQQASIAAEVKKAELEAQRPKPVPEYFLLLLLYFQRHRRKMARVGVFLLLLKAFWTFSGSNSSISGRWSELWRGIIRLLQRRNLLGDGLFVGQQHRLPLAPLPPLQDSGETATASTGSDLGTLDKELEHQGLSEYNQVLRDTGYDDMGVLRELREEEEATKSVDVAKEMEGMKIGLLHFFDKLTTKQLRESPLPTIKIADLKHIMSSVGEKMTEEELEEMARELRNSCKIEDGRVVFDDFVNLLK